MSYDVLVIGGGPAGLSAAINIRARGKSVLVISNPLEENPLWRSPLIENYPGLPGITGPALLTALQQHARRMGADFREGKVLSAFRMDKLWYVSFGTEMEQAPAVVLAAGVDRGRKFPGEAEFLGRGVSYCATCDGMLYRDKPVAVLGYSGTARREADFLSGIGCRVTYFDQPRQCEITGDTQVRAVTCDGRTAAVDGVFLLRPTMALTDLFPTLEMEDGHVRVNRQMAASEPGLFAAGDCTGGPLQAAKAVGEGQIAGQQAAAWAAQSK